MENIYYNHTDKMKQCLLGYASKKFSFKQEFYNYVGNFLLEKDPENPYILDNINDWKEAKANFNFTEDMLCQGYKLWYEISHDDIVFLAEDHMGDGNPLEVIYALLDHDTKEYTLVAISGYYSSWDSSHFDSCTQVELKEKTVSYFDGVNYASN